MVNLRPPAPSRERPTGRRLRMLGEAVVVALKVVAAAAALYAAVKGSGPADC